jgi:chromate reductase, NAD(P)H dehydrogenase (quinone)
MSANNILAISGSLRQTSSNTTLLQAAIFLSKRSANELAPSHLKMQLYAGLNDLPHFNPDLETTVIPAVLDLQTKIKWADGLLISTPEYAHGMPGSLKNALDWLVSSEDFIGMPIALFNASPRATHAQVSLVEVLTTMAGQIVPAASITVPLMGKNLDMAGILADSEIAAVIRQAIDEFAAFINQNSRSYVRQSN